jgi:hypothetical protein
MLEHEEETSIEANTNDGGRVSTAITTKETENDCSPYASTKSKLLR